MTSFENYVKSLVIADAIKTFGDPHIRSRRIQNTLKDLSESDPELKKALEVELNRQNLI